MEAVEVFQGHAESIQPEPAAEVVASGSRWTEDQQPAWGELGPVVVLIGLMSFQVKDWTDHFQLAQFHSRSGDGAEGLCPGIVCFADQCGQGMWGLA